MTSKDNKKHQNQVISTHESLLAEEQIKVFEGEVETNISNLVAAQENFASKMKMMQEELGKEMKKISSFNAVLRQLPKQIDDKLQEKINPIAGEVANSITSGLSGTLGQQMQQIDDSIEASKGSLAILNADIKAFELRSWRKSLLKTLFMATLSAIIAGLVSYITISFYPSTVRLDNAQNINLKHGEVTLFRADTINTKKITETPKMRQRR